MEFSTTRAESLCQLVIPAHLHQKIVDEQPDESIACHFSMKKISKRFGCYFYWKGMNADVLKNVSPV